ncbi:hypothetical protein CYMTET_41103 [Cymbomonas tetramitiformis]|uniref:Uncharacterized protein n=1 Tax=Cymbomonas tetramitiformis TaxID=36881 RepID=A0AAE0F2Z3_9CHLO|nr:hypothetical protein CYMTET_41103 [Cymbomonas tetramitiformis]
MSHAREFNADAEQVAADRRARVASAVAQQEWLDKQEVQWIPKKEKRIQFRHGEDGFKEEELDDEENLAYLMGPEPEDVPEQQLQQSMKNNGLCYAVVLFTILMAAIVYFFWDSMHEHTDPHKPLVDADTLVPAAASVEQDVLLTAEFFLTPIQSLTILQNILCSPAGALSSQPKNTYYSLCSWTRPPESDWYILA